MRRQWSHEAHIKQGPAALAALPYITAGMTALTTIKSLTQKAPKAPKMSDSPVTVMPTEDSALVQEAKRRTLVAQAAKGGRMSTVLTDNEDKFGGN